MRRLLLLVVACSSPSPRIDPSPPPPPDAAVRADVSSSQLRVKKPFKLQVFDLEPTRAGAAAAAILTAELVEMAREYAGIRLGTSRMQMLDLMVMAGCNAKTPPCLTTIARSANADRMLYGTVDGATAKIYLFAVDTQVIVEWSTDKLPSERPQLAAIAHDAIQSLLSRAP